MTRLGLLALCLASTAWAKPPEAPADTTLEMTAEARATALAGPATALASGDDQAAGDALLALTADPAMAEVHGAAWAMLAGLFEKHDLLIPAAEAWSKAILLDPDGNASKLMHAAEISDTIKDRSALAPVLGNNLGLAVDGPARNKLAETAGLYHLRQGNYGPALGALMMGDKDAPGFADVELLRGVVLAQQERYTDAVPPLLTAQALGRQDKRGEAFDDVVTLNVARAYYGAENWAQSMAWYAKVERRSDDWLDAQFERAWAHFRAEDTNGSLGLLMNHSSPFFESYYYPEAHLLRAYSLFMMCKFPDASKEMDHFVEKYTPIQAEVTSLLGSLSPEDAFAQAAAFREGSATSLPAYLLRDFRNEDRFSDALAFVARAEQESQRTSGLPGKAGDFAKRTIDGRSKARVNQEGDRVLGKVRSAKAQLDEMLTGVEITRLDLLSLEAKMYQRAAATGHLDYGDRVGKLRKMKKQRKGFRVWPWEGEYWADELGWYELDARPDCPESLAHGEEKDTTK